ncbi:hypothetical protein GCM10011608_10020 [Micromonospora sonchi]|uniref:Uncharacterized protein n=1 Tax=Micromonospora sonchi TaxID=1763543 RepID=A0A917TL36_9ACTN|nr:hypothetical protein [Micromonospora sonchi]GGM27263.1 hypothetical protein GCM10011608_10020 [Micromonospora sonchi]
MFEGACVGGPLDGQQAVSRCPDGLLVADKPAGVCWLYDWRDGRFQVREEEPRQLDTDRAVSAALSDGWDVIALPQGVPDGGT